jgi:hypothetical protein
MLGIEYAKENNKVKNEEAPGSNGHNSIVGFTNLKMDLSAIKSVVHSKFLHALKTRAYNRNGIVSFPEVSRVSSWWGIRKHERDMLLYDLQQEGYLKIIPYHGIMLEGQGQR